MRWIPDFGMGDDPKQMFGLQFFLFHPYSARISENVGNIIIGGGLLPRILIKNEDILRY